MNLLRDIASERAIDFGGTPSVEAKIAKHALDAIKQTT
jgi:hypothetical protein